MVSASARPVIGIAALVAPGEPLPNETRLLPAVSP
jgi:hypothetical protein